MSQHITADLPAALTTIVGAAHVTADPASCAALAIGAAAPGCVVAPGTAEELAATLRLASERGVAVVPWGGGTQQLIGAPPEAGWLALRTTRLSRVLYHEPADLTISVEAGMTLGALRDHLARHGQMLPLDPPLPDRATIGGLIATAADGPRRLGYGTLRDLLIGIAVADTAGKITRGGGMVVKNVSGFDMMKLYLGSLGTLAVVVSANFKLLPAPRAAASLVCRFASLDAAGHFLDALSETQLTPTAAELLCAVGAGAAGPPWLPPPGAALVALRAEGLAAAVERHMADLAALAVRHSAAEVQRHDGTHDAALWAEIAELPQAAALAPDQALLKLTMLPSEVGHTLQQIAQSGHSGLISARALSGVIYARLGPLDAAGLAALVERVGGLQWAATTLDGAPRWGQPAGLELMRRIKTEFDSTGTLNPGRFVAEM